MLCIFLITLIIFLTRIGRTCCSQPHLSGTNKRKLECIYSSVNIIHNSIGICLPWSALELHRPLQNKGRVIFLISRVTGPDQAFTDITFWHFSFSETVPLNPIPHGEYNDSLRQDCKFRRFCSTFLYIMKAIFFFFHLYFHVFARLNVQGHGIFYLYGSFVKRHHWGP
jgi:hypothetical protein